MTAQMWRFPLPRNVLSGTRPHPARGLYLFGEARWATITESLRGVTLVIAQRARCIDC
jgi:hypothetical protein